MNGGIKESSGGVSPGMKYLIHFKNLLKCHSVSSLSTTIKENNNSNYKRIGVPMGFRVMGGFQNIP
jgi:hypothetical protein